MQYRRRKGKTVQMSFFGVLIKMKIIIYSISKMFKKKNNNKFSKTGTCILDLTKTTLICRCVKYKYCKLRITKPQNYRYTIIIVIIISIFS